MALEFDKLPAAAGIATRIHEVTGSDYIALPKKERIMKASCAKLLESFKVEGGHRKMLESPLLRRSKVLLRRLAEQNCVGKDFIKVPIIRC